MVLSLTLMREEKK